MYEIIKFIHRMADGKKREKKAIFKSIKNKLKARGFDSRVDREDTTTIASYLNQEFEHYCTRLVETHGKQTKAIADAKQLRRRQRRQ